MVRAEVASNAFLDERCRLGDAEQVQLIELGWSAPTYGVDDEIDGGSPNFFVDVERREADRLAVMVVGALRNAFGCAHPAFLDADGLEIDPDAATPVAPAGEEPDEPVAVFPDSQDELRELVDRALAVMYEEPLKHDGDGDVPIVAGRSVLYVRVLADRPAVELFAELVVDVTDRDRAAGEMAILNRSHPVAKFYLRDDRVLMTYAIHAWPFAPAQLRVAVSYLCEGLDDLARDAAARVGGRRFLDAAPASEPSAARSRAICTPRCWACWSCSTTGRQSRDWWRRSSTTTGTRSSSSSSGCAPASTAPGARAGPGAAPPAHGLAFRCRPRLGTRRATDPSRSPCAEPAVVAPPGWRGHARLRDVEPRSRGVVVSETTVRPAEPMHADDRLYRPRPAAGRTVGRCRSRPS